MTCIGLWQWLSNHLGRSIRMCLYVPQRCSSCWDGPMWFEHIQIHTFPLCKPNFSEYVSQESLSLWHYETYLKWIYSWTQTAVELYLKGQMFVLVLVVVLLVHAKLRQSGSLIAIIQPTVFCSFSWVMLWTPLCFFKLLVIQVLKLENAHFCAYVYVMRPHTNLPYTAHAVFLYAPTESACTHTVWPLTVEWCYVLLCCLTTMTTLNFLQDFSLAA